MSRSRYTESSTLRGGLKTAKTVASIRSRIRRNQIQTTDRILKQGERLDTIAQEVYGDGRLWWVIAAASNIGWCWQVPEGTLVKVPLDITSVM